MMFRSWQAYPKSITNEAGARMIYESINLYVSNKAIVESAPTDNNVLKKPKL